MRNRALARALLTTAALPSIWFGLLYLGRTLIGADGWSAGYHARLAGGMDHGALSPPLMALYATLVGVMGSLYLATGLTTLLLSRRAAEQGNESTAWWALLTLNGVGLVGLVATNLRNGLDSPWWMNLIVLAIVGAGLALAGRGTPAREAATASVG